MRSWFAGRKIWIAAVGLVVLAVGALALTLRGNGGGLDSAERYLASHEPAKAVLELKSLLQGQPDAAEARLLLGRAQMALNAPAAAEAEFGRAIEAGVPIERVAADMAASLRMQGRAAEVLRRFAQVKPSDPTEAAALLTQRAWAYVDGRQLEAATIAIQEALARAPGYVPAQLLQARMRGAAGDLREAEVILEPILQMNPRDAHAWALKGDLDRSETSRWSAAAKAYQKAISLAPHTLAAHEGLVSVLLLSGDLTGARNAWNQMSRTSPANGMTVFLDAVLALKEGDPRRARLASQRLLKGGVQTPALLMVAGQAEYRLQGLLQAQVHFAKAVSQAPADPLPRLHLAMAYLRQGQSARALEALQPLLDPGSRHAQAWALAGHAYVALGDVQRSSTAFDRAAKLAPRDLVIRTERAQAKLAQGRGAEGLAELTAIAATDTRVTADLALVAGHLQSKNYEAALKAIEGLSRKEPESTLVDTLRGQVALAQGDRVQARSHFEKALGKSADDLNAIRQLTQLDMAEGQAERAYQRLEALLRKEPGNTEAVLGLLEVTRVSGWRPASLGPHLEESVRVNPLEPALRVAWIDHLRAAGDVPAAMAAAQSAVVAMPSEPLVLERVATLYQQVGDRNRALVVWKQLAALQPLPSGLNLRVAQALAVLGAGGDAEGVVRATLQADPNSLQAERAAIALAFQLGQRDRARKLAVELQQRRPDEAAGFEMEADMLSAVDDWAAALPRYQKAIGKRNVGGTPAGLHRGLLQTQGEEAAKRFQVGWLKQHPDDIGYLLFLSKLATDDGKFGDAIVHLRNVVDLAPANALAHNNLAHLLMLTRQQGALESAERAVALAPQAPAFLDTLAMILGEQDRLQDALKVQRRVLDLAPEGGAFRLNLARLLIKAGDRPAAREELTRMAALGDRFAGHADVAQLIASLGELSQASSTERVGAVTLESVGAAPLKSLPTWLWALGVGLLVLMLPSVVLIAAIRPASYGVDASVTVAAAVDRTFDALFDLRNWSTWSPLPAFHEARAMQFVGPPSSPGSACEWRGTGSATLGRIEVVQAARPSKLVVEATTGSDHTEREVWKFQLAEPKTGTTQILATLQVREAFWTRLLNLLTMGKARQRRRLTSALARFGGSREAVEYASEELPVPPTAQAASAGLSVG